MATIPTTNSSDSSAASSSNGQASSLLVMAILGGAILPAILRHFADVWSLQTSLIVPLIAYAYVAFYGWKGHQIGRQLAPRPS